jgi:hypothetical protein
MSTGDTFRRHNFGPFGHIFFVIVSFEAESKTLFRVLFSSLCLQIFIFYFCIYKIFLARPVKETLEETYIKTKRCLHPRGLEKPEINSTDQSTRSVCTCIGLYMAKHTRGASVRVKTRYFEKFNINIFTLPYSNKTFYTKALAYKEYFTHMTLSKFWRV